MLAHSLQPKRSRPPRELEKAKTNKQTNKQTKTTINYRVKRDLSPWLMRDRRQSNRYFSLEVVTKRVSYLLRNCTRATSFSFICVIRHRDQWAEFIVKSGISYSYLVNSCSPFLSCLLHTVWVLGLPFELTYFYHKSISRSAHDSSLDRLCHHGHFGGALHEASLGKPVWEKGVVPGKCLG